MFCVHTGPWPHNNVTSVTKSQVCWPESALNRAGGLHITNCKMTSGCRRREAKWACAGAQGRAFLGGGSRAGATEAEQTHSPWRRTAGALGPEELLLPPTAVGVGPMGRGRPCGIPRCPPGSCRLSMEARAQERLGWGTGNRGGWTWQDGKPRKDPGSEELSGGVVWGVEECPA